MANDVMDVARSAKHKTRLHTTGIELVKFRVAFHRMLLGVSQLRREVWQHSPSPYSADANRLPSSRLAESPQIIQLSAVPGHVQDAPVTATSGSGQPAQSATLLVHSSGRKAPRTIACTGER